MPTDLSFLNNIFQPLFLLKLFILIIIFFYVIFSSVVSNQIRVMNKIETIPPVAEILQILAIIHLMLAFSLFFLAVAIL